ncbi:uncharacterized protein LOC142986297 [Anticarsia gemmatalis]|uniref:uncharacterized protein LOC142986297 n=1 Tax=Anticarsia gemmatalis TaxID=129554 RepID=UPI003F76124C
MKMLKLVFVLIALMLVTAARAGVINTNSIVASIEEHCVLQGGACTLMKDCPPDNVVMHGSVNLCPMQHHLGVICCYL